MVFWKRKREETNTPIPSEESPIESNELDDDPSAEFAETAETSDSSNTTSWWRRVLTKTNELLKTDIRDLWAAEGRLVDDEFLSELYAILVRTDMGNAMATKIKDSIHDQYRARKIEMENVLEIIRNEIGTALKNKKAPLKFADSGPTCILVVGVNGSGKTTSIAKLAYRLTRHRNKVLLGAGDTFRAAAVEQLKIWSDRIGCDIVLGEHGSDPGSVAYRTLQKAIAGNYDVCIIDTAGRLQTQNNLMQELEKIKRVIAKQIEGAPHEVLLVLDATAGQNAISQAKGFSQAAGCTGIVLAKLDGSAKGGVIVPIAEQFGLPVKFVGLGERLEDLAIFNPEEFTKALFQ
jgi:fused signal recognition particle receptor